MLLSKDTADSLKAYWVEYGIIVPFAEVFDYRFNGHYIVLAWENSEGKIELVDLTYVSGKWEMQNDGFEPITPAQWKKLRIVTYCDSFTYPGMGD
jgi:hypothetical protein